MSNQELFHALGMLKESSRDLATSLAINNANEAVQQIKSQVANEGEQRAALHDISNQLVMRLAAGGVPATTIAQLAGAVGPRRYGSAAEMAIEGTMMGGEKGQQLVGAAANVDRAAQAGNIDQLKMQQQFQATESEKNRQHQLQLAGLKSTSRGGTGGVPLTASQIDKIQGFDAEDIAAKSILTRVTSNPALTGLGMRTPGAKTVRSIMDKDFDTFQAETNRWFDAYRQRVTGAGASEAELANLRRNMPTVDDSPTNFKSKVQNIMQIGTKVRARYLSNLKKGKRDTSGFETGEESAPASGQPDWQSFIKR